MKKVGENMADIVIVIFHRPALHFFLVLSVPKFIGLATTGPACPSPTALVQESHCDTVYIVE